MKGRKGQFLSSLFRLRVIKKEVWGMIIHKTLQTRVRGPNTLIRRLSQDSSWFMKGWRIQLEKFIHPETTHRSMYDFKSRVVVPIERVVCGRWYVFHYPQETLQTNTCGFKNKKMWSANNLAFFNLITNINLSLLKLARTNY